MALCGKCGATFDDNQAACPACGTPAGVQGQQVPPPGYQAPPQGYQQPPQGGYQQPQQGYQQPYPPQGGYADPNADAQNNKAMGILAYLGFLWLVPLLAAKDSPFARYHANQGLVLFIAEAALWIVYYILLVVLLAVAPVLGLLTTLLSVVIWIGSVVFMIMGIINAAKGEMKPLPLIGGITILK